MLADGNVIIDRLEVNNTGPGNAVLVNGMKTPIVLEFVCLDGKAQLQLYCQWQGRHCTLFSHHGRRKLAHSRFDLGPK
ncbi:MAG: hypothetical protein ACYS29_06435 [Planctomycetota bacterium]